ncbi:MAG: hypothetical protein KJS97_09415 [Alphaproteobacteria bacterium]|nr:hypothetical protein [Alphaproteobacteria bacterium]
MIAMLAVVHYRVGGGWRLGAFAGFGLAYTLAIAHIVAPILKPSNVHVGSSWTLERNQNSARLCASDGTCLPLSSRRFDGAGTAYSLRKVAQAMSVAAPDRVFAVHFVDEGVVKVERCARGE